MKLLILGNFHALSNAVQYATALRALGHETITVGPRFASDDAARWRTALLAMAWPPDWREADAYVAKVLAESPVPDMETEPGQIVSASRWPDADAAVLFWSYGDAPGLVNAMVPTALIVGDTHTGHLDSQIAAARDAAHVFVQFRRADMAAFRDAGHPSVHWLPPAADPAVWFHAPEMDKRYDVLFVGATDPRVHRQRCELLSFLKRELGDERVAVRHAFGSEAALLMNQAKVVLNRSLAGDLNMRVVEAMCAGAVLLTDDVDGLRDLEVPPAWPQVGFYNDGPSALVRAVSYVESGEAWNRAHGGEARQLVLQRHTYRHRAQHLLNVLFGQSGEGLHDRRRAFARRDALGRRWPVPYPVPADDVWRADDPQRPRVSLVIPVHNHFDDCTVPLLDRLDADEEVKGGHRAEVVLVDDGSTDETARLGMLVRKVVRQANAGFASACNLGAQHAVGDVLVFLNNDTAPEPGWLAPLMAALDDGAGIAGARLVHPTPDPGGNHGATQSAGLVPNGDGAWSNMNFLLHKPEHGPYEVKAVTGACLAIRRELFWRLGGFDAGFGGGGGCEDVDLCLRARAAGERVVVVPDSVVVHREGSTRFAGEMAEGTRRQIAANTERLKERWGDGSLPGGRRDGGGADGGSAQPVPGGAGAGVAVGSDGAAEDDAGAAPGPNVAGGVDPVGPLAMVGARPLTVVWDGPLDVATGGSLAVINRALVERLRDRDDLRVLLPPVVGGPPPDVYVSHYWPGPQAHRPPPEGTRAWVVIQPWEDVDVEPPAAWDGTWQHPAFRELWAPSRYSLACLSTWFASLANRGHVIPNGVDTALFTPNGDGLRDHAAEGGRDVFRFLFVGGLIGRKGIDLLYDAWAAFAAGRDDVRLVLKAQGADTFYGGQSVRPPAVLPHVQLLDADLTGTQMAKLYRSCDALVAPSRAEGFHLPTLEAMASGLPVIVPDGPPWNEYVPPSAAWRFRSGDVDSLAQALAALSGDEMGVDEVGTMGRAAAMRYDWSRVVQLVARRLQELGGG